MAKDPAFLFYPGDWLGGTMTFSRHHKGAYMDILMGQFNNGRLTIEDIQTILGADFETMWEQKLRAKFQQDETGKFFNEKLENEMIKRRNYSESRRKNLKSSQKKPPHMDTHVVSYMENGNGNENINKKGKKGAGKKTKPEMVVNHHPFSDGILQHWDKWKTYKQQEFKKGYKTLLSEQAAFNRLVDISGSDEVTAIELINHAIAMRWQGIYNPNEKQQHGKQNRENSAAAISIIAKAAHSGNEIDFSAFKSQSGSSGMEKS